MSSAVKVPPTRVLVRPFYPDFLGNKLFTGGKDLNDRWLEPYVRVRELAATRGIEIDTWDMHALESADVVMYQDLPTHRHELLDAKRKAPHARFVLMLVESPLGRPHCFHNENHSDFDIILTYNWRLCDEKRYFRYYLPIGTAPPAADPPYSQRKPLVMINSNRLLGPMGLLAFRQPGLSGLPGIAWLFRDWKVGASGMLHQTRGELYSRRRKLARLADREFPGLLEVFGPGWSGEPVGWISKFIRPKPFACACGPSGRKDDLLPQYRFGIAFENVVGDVGYISEKIFDTLSAGVVPIYFGDERIAEHVDPACFVDARKFASDGDLLNWVRDCPESEWRRLREAGQKYITSDTARKFQSEAFAQRMLDVLELAARKPR